MKVPALKDPILTFFFFFLSLQCLTLECQTKMFLMIQKPSHSFCREFQNSVGGFLVETNCETEVLPETGLPSHKPKQLSLTQTRATNPGLGTRYFNKALALLFSVAINTSRQLTSCLTPVSAELEYSLLTHGCLVRKVLRRLFAQLLEEGPTGKLCTRATVVHLCSWNKLACTDPFCSVTCSSVGAILPTLLSSRLPSSSQTH